MPQIEISALSKRFAIRNKEDLTVLDTISLGIEQGEFVHLLGPSGCGKSTLLRILAGLETPSDGTLRIAGEAGRRGFQRVGVVFQAATLLPWLSVRDNVLYPAGAISRPLRDQMRERADELLAMTGLAHAAGQYPHQISGGMQQRAAICRALLLDPDVLLMDEPFSALDAMTREDLQLELLRIQERTGKTIVFVTHSIAEAVLMSSRVIVLAAHPGRVAEDMANPLPYPRSHASLASDAAQAFVDLGRTVGNALWRDLLTIRLPHAAPFIFSGLKIGMSLSVIGAVVGEFITAQRGLGYLIISSTTNFDLARAMAAVVILALLSVALLQAIQLLQRLLTPWSAATRSSR